MNSSDSIAATVFREIPVHTPCSLQKSHKLSVALIVIGNELGSFSNRNNPTSTDGQIAEKARNLSNIEMGADGYPILWLKSKSKEGVVVKPYRTSYVRAALLISSTRQDAQMKVRKFFAS